MTVLTTRFAEALAYAGTAHAGQERRGTPMIGHLLSVAGLVLELGGDEDEAIGALLHDAAEEAGGRERVADIERHFGRVVARIVEDCTDSFDPNLDWRQKKERYLRHLPEAGASSLFVGAADKLSNVRQLRGDLRLRGQAAWDDCRGGREGRLWYYTALAAAYPAAGESRVSPLLRAAVSGLSRRAV